MGPGKIAAALTDWRWSNALVDELPARYERSIISQYTTKYKKDPVQANVGLRILMNKLKRLKMPLSAIYSDDTAAAWGRQECRLIWTNSKGNYQRKDELIARYMHVARKVKAAGFVPVGSERKSMSREQCALFTTQMLRESWWARQAKVAAARAREYIAISLGFVSAKADPYCSRETLSEWKKAQLSAVEFLNSNFIGYDNGADEEMQIISLAQASEASTANPKNRFLEMMTRVRGIKEAATELGWTANFVTWTAPGVYHKNGKWNGSDPKETQQYLNSQWAKARADIKAAKIDMAGMRVAEPHNDGTPHWHILVFTPKQQAEPALKIMQHYATQHLKQELAKGIKPRFFVEKIDPLKGCAVAYISKYISKSINASYLADDIDDETGLPAIQVDEHGKEIWNSGHAVRAWASRWGIRQFQFFGAPPVTVWREMRRLSEPLADEQAEAIRLSAGEKGKKNASFKRFCQLMGGLCAKRKDHPVKILAAEDESTYGEQKTRTVGLVIASNGWEIITRKAWVKLGSAVSAFWRAQPALQRASGAARTRENNCKLQPDPDSVNAKIAAAKTAFNAVIGYLNRFGEWVTETVNDYYQGISENAEPV